ncbi:hypothetical protein M9978_02950 [Sphingomonas sp. MG17]|uniref:Uncharacterized protein n=1 Tax=Sphingomonas tagetis TaxID=2949092 RepID=A0A9X2HE09_9SPHN|nr:hypothetical protein [Sphingomonas tagetis]MCP3729376.1 hypothetical protein [Sphingomonas tagetis]
MKYSMGIAAVAALAAAGNASAQVTTHIATKGALRNHSTEVCKERGKSVALTLDMTSGGDTLSTWMVRPGSATTTVVRCDMPQWVVVISAGPDWNAVNAQNNQVVEFYNKIGGN